MKMYERIKNMTKEQMSDFIYWVYMNGNADEKDNLCDTYGNSYFGGALLDMDADDVMPKVYDLRDMMYETSKWVAIKNDFVCEDSNKIDIDAWLTDDDNEEGKVIARIDMNTQNIEYFDDDAKTDPYAQEIIREAIDELRYLKLT